MPCLLTLQAGKAYVWDPKDVVWLRNQCRIVGALTGNCADNKTRSATGGLPCEFSPEELRLALNRGWVTVQQEPATVLGPLLLQTVPNNGHATAVEQSMSALSAKKGIIIPTAGARLALNHADDLGTDILQPDELKSAVFTDLHDKGYYVTDGAKFGTDYLLYPGDPFLFHAQFTVQPMPHSQNIAANLLLGHARGSHAARKHLLIASGTSQDLFYVTVAPEDGFGSKAQQL